MPGMGAPGKLPSDEGSNSMNPLGMIAQNPMVMSSFVSLGLNMKDLMNDAQKVSDDCIGSDMTMSMRIAESHMQSMTYLKGHLMANGADVLGELTSAAAAYGNENLTEFGQHIGTAFRKVFLSNSTGNRLPEGLPGKGSLLNMTQGLIDGFFGRGFNLEVNSPELAHNPIHLDVQQCLGMNTPFFESVWRTVTYIFGRLSVAASPLSEPGSVFSAAGVAKTVLTPRLGMSLAINMVQIPSVLRTCNISADQEEMLVDSLMALRSGGLPHVGLDAPPAPKTNSSRTALDIGQIGKAWEDGEYSSFGLHLGELMQGMVLRVFPLKYTVLSSGQLTKKIGETGSATGISALLPGCAALMVTAAVAAAYAGWRRRRPRWTRSHAMLTSLARDPEEATCDEDTGNEGAAPRTEKTSRREFKIHKKETMMHKKLEERIVYTETLL